MRTVAFFREIHGGDYRLGTAVQYAAGWRFLSNVAAHKNSRKYHPTMEACVPRWVGYPDKCITEVTKED